MSLKAPFPYFGGKRRVVSLVWDRLGDPANYIEPFAGSAAMLLGRPSSPRIETLNDADCVALGTRILRADLTWARAGDVTIGDRLMGFDEFNGPAREGFRAPKSYRRWRVATVTGFRVLRKPSYRLTFDDGTSVVASADHQWLGGSHVTGGRGWRWQRTDGLVCNRETQRSWVCKPVDVVEPDRSYEAGWIAGFFDGEGHVARPPGWRVVASQREGTEADRLESLLAARGYRASRILARRSSNPAHNPVVQIGFNGGMREVLRFLMMVRPERLIRNLVASLPERSFYGREKQAVGLVAKEFLGEQEVAAIETDCHTFIADGLASHNCFVANFWRAIQQDHEAVAAFADGPVNEADLHARHRWLVGVDEPEPVVPPEWDRHTILRQAYLAGYARQDGSYARAFRRKMRTDPDYYDAKVAGWWCWGLCCWIGSGWCTDRGAASEKMPLSPRANGDCSGGNAIGVHATAPVAKRPQLHTGNSEHGRGVHGEAKGLGEQMPHLGSGGGPGAGVESGRGVHAKGPSEKRPILAGAASEHGERTHLGLGVHSMGPSDSHRPQIADAYGPGRGVHAGSGGMSQQRPFIAGGHLQYGMGVHAKGSPVEAGTCAARRAWLVEWFGRLRDRLRTVRVCCGDWLRVCDSPSVTTRLGTTGIFLDPPYSTEAGRTADLYGVDCGEVAHAVRAYCLERGADPRMRIVLAGYESEGHEALEAAGWGVIAWKADGGYGNRTAKGKENAGRERLWTSPHCLDPDATAGPLFRRGDG